MLRNAALLQRHYGKHAGQLFFRAQLSTAEPNKPIELDPALQALLQDADKSLTNFKAKRSRQQSSKDMNLERAMTSHRELEVVSRTITKQAADDVDEALLAGEEDAVFPRSERKSPAASFGSRQIGTVILPYEMQKSIMALISESEKPLIHVDADRLFNHSKDEEKSNRVPSSWSLHYTPTRNTEARSSSKISHIKARLNRIRDGTAFASVVMPAQYAVIRAVLEQTKGRLGDEWAQKVDRVIEWGSGTGAGIWAAHHTFQKLRESPPNDESSSLHQMQEDSAREDLRDRFSRDRDIPRNLQLQQSNLKSYMAVEKRDGLSNIARKLLNDISTSSSISIQRELADEPLSVSHTEGSDRETIAISAFLLSTIQTIGSKKAMLREMWNSGADLMVIIEDASADGFKDVTDARDFLLRLGNEQSESTDSDVTFKHGAHVVAPCPHDKPCPLAFHQKISPSKRAFEVTSSLSGMARCTFMQRLQRPSFVRLTKHAKRGEEDVGYSYVVIRRGDRARPPFAVGQLLGREGAVARWAEDARKAKEADLDKTWVMHESDINAVSAVSVDADADRVVLVDAVEEKIISQDTQGEEVIAVDGLVEEEDLASVSSSLEPDNLPLQDDDLEASLREESYSWPRINFSPLKRNGHVIIDACMPEGNIMRMTFPRSQGKQIYYDARKSSWGDIFPHAPKHQPIPRFTGRPGKTAKASLKEALDEESAEERELVKLLNPSDHDEARGKKTKRAAQDVANATRAGWSGVMGQLKNEEKKRRQERRNARNQKEADLLVD